MKAGLIGTDAYLEQWRREAAGSVEGDPAELAATEAARLDAAYGPERLKGLIEGGGRA